MPGVAPERTARSVRTKAAADKTNATPAVSRTLETSLGGSSIFAKMFREEMILRRDLTSILAIFFFIYLLLAFMTVNEMMKC